MKTSGQLIQAYLAQLLTDDSKADHLKNYGYLINRLKNLAELGADSSTYTCGELEFSVYKRNMPLYLERMFYIHGTPIGDGTAWIGTIGVNMEPHNWSVVVGALYGNVNDVVKAHITMPIAFTHFTILAANQELYESIAAQLKGAH